MNRGESSAQNYLTGLHTTVLEDLLRGHFLGVKNHRFACGCPEDDRLSSFDKNARQWNVPLFRCRKLVRPKVFDSRALDFVCIEPIVEVMDYKHVFPRIVRKTATEKDSMRESDDSVVRSTYMR